MRGRTWAEDYLHQHHNGNARNVDLDKAAESWTKTKKTSPKPKPKAKAKPASKATKPPPQDENGLPSLIESSTDNTDSEADSDSFCARFPEAVPNPNPKSPKRQKMKEEDVVVPKKVEPTGIKNPDPPVSKKNEGKAMKPGFLIHSNNDPVKKTVPEKKAAPEKKTAPPPQPKTPQPEVVKPPPQKEHQREVFMRLAKEASSCYKESIFQGAKDKFGECLALIDSSHKALNISHPKKNSEVVVIKFMYARACTGHHTYKVNSKDLTQNIPIKISMN